MLLEAIIMLICIFSKWRGKLQKYIDYNTKLFILKKLLDSKQTVLFHSTTTLILRQIEYVPWTGQLALNLNSCLLDILTMSTKNSNFNITFSFLPFVCVSVYVVFVVSCYPFHQYDTVLASPPLPCIYYLCVGIWYKAS